MTYDFTDIGFNDFYSQFLDRILNAAFFYCRSGTKGREVTRWRKNWGGQETYLGVRQGEKILASHLPQNKINNKNNSEIQNFDPKNSFAYVAGPGYEINVPEHDKTNKMTGAPIKNSQLDQSLRCPHEEALGPQLSLKLTAKTLIRQGWSSLVILFVLSCSGSIIIYQMFVLVCIFKIRHSFLWQTLHYFSIQDSVQEGHNL